MGLSQTFEFATATRILFGPGVSQHLAEYIKPGITRVLLLTGSRIDRIRSIIDRMETHKVEMTPFTVKGEPTVDLVRKAARKARETDSEMIISIGGGSVLDAGKAAAALAANPHDIMDYLEVIGRGEVLTEQPLPFFAVPTTAGTGTEVTRNAVITSLEKKVKVSLRHAFMLPDLAAVDPLLTHTMPPPVTASTGLDALSQLIEPYVSLKANPLVDSICREGLKCASRSLKKAFDNGDDPQAREDMALASLFSGLALANAKLGAVHGIAGPMGGMFQIPHGVICGRLLPWVFEANIKTVEKMTAVNSDSLSRFQDIAQILTGDKNAGAEDGIEWLKNLCEHLHLPGLSAYGLSEEAFPELVQKSQKASSMKGNPVVLNRDELYAILAKSL